MGIAASPAAGSGQQPSRHPSSDRARGAPIAAVRSDRHWAPAGPWTNPRGAARPPAVAPAPPILPRTLPGQPADDTGIGAGRALVYSALLPGAGQYAMGQRRWFGYLLLEAVGWAFWLDRRGKGHDLRNRYRDLAWATARTVGMGPRTDGDFAYYETLVHWERSGRWDIDPSSPELDPEEDPTTFNGSIWLLARQLYLGPDANASPGDPSWDRALDYYRSRAYGPGFLWDWTPFPGEQSHFADLIEDSDDRLREATIALGLVTANHVLSAVDAFVSARLRDATDGRVDAALSLGHGPWSGTGGTPWAPAGLPPVVVEFRLRP